MSFGQHLSQATAWGLHVFTSIYEKYWTISLALKSVELPQFTQVKDQAKTQWKLYCLRIPAYVFF